MIRFVRKGVRNQIFLEWLVKLLVPGVVIPLCLIMLAAGELLPSLVAWVFVPLFMLLALGVYVWGLFARIFALTGKYDKGLFHGAKLNQLGGEVSPGRKRPSLYLTTTSLTTGELCCYTPDGFHRRDRSPENAFGYPDCLVARAVAASSAFPPAFDPVKLTAGDLGNPIDSSEPPKPRFPAEMRLTDGGVFDNLGVKALEVFATPRPQISEGTDSQRQLRW